MKRPTWTLDGSKVAYIDRAIVAWVLRQDLKQQYILDTPYVDVQELKWSPDGRYLALRTDDDVYIYDTECKP
jgi:WD40 repeat protein